LKNNAYGAKWIILCLVIVWLLLGFTLSVNGADLDKTSAIKPMNDTPRLRVGMPLPGAVPFFWQDTDGHFRGIYADILRMIAQRLEVTLEFIPLTQARLIRQFEIGQLDLEVGVVEESKQNAPHSTLSSLSLFTQSFWVVNNVIIYRPELSFPIFILPDLKGKTVAAVRGRPVPEHLVREDFTNQWQIAQRVHRGWNEIGLMTESVALYYQRRHQLNYKISLPYASDPVSFRLHRNQAHRLADFNRVISELEQEGLLDKLVCLYLCGKSR